MPTSDLRIYSGKEILLAYYNRQFQRNIGLEDIEFDTPVKLTAPTNYNTVIRLYPRLGSRYYGSPRLFYDRIHVSYLGTIVVPKGMAVRTHDLLNAINEKYSINLTEEDVENDLLDPFSNGNIVVSLRIKPTSVMFYDGAIVYTPNYPDPASLPGPTVDRYAFWSPTKSSSAVVLSNSNKTALMNHEHLAISEIPITDGKVYWEVTVDNGSLFIGVGIAGGPTFKSLADVVGDDEYSWVLDTATGKIHHNGVESNYTDPIPAGSVVGIMLDKDAGLLYYKVANIVKPIAFSGLNLFNDVYPIITGSKASNSRGTANFGDIPFFYAVPAGYARGVYTVYTPGGATVPPPGTGGSGGVTHPAGTVLGTFCQEEDKWAVVADGTGKFVISLIDINSVDCGYDASEPPIIDGGDSGSGGSGLPMLSAIGGPFTMDEDNPLVINYVIAPVSAAPVSLVFGIEHVSTNDSDVTSYEYKVGVGGSWTAMVVGDVITVPSGESAVSIRITANADLMTEGFETIRIVLSEMAPGGLLGNTASVKTAVVITDTSKNVGPTISLNVTSDPISVNEGSFSIVPFTFSSPTTEVVNLIFTVDYEQTSAIDHGSIIYNLNGSVDWIDFVSGDTIAIPIGTSGFSIRIGSVPDYVTEGPETYSVTVTESVIGAALTNTGPLTKQVLVNDTSTLYLFVSGPTSVDEGTSFITTYTLSSHPKTPLTLEFTSSHVTTDSSDFSLFEYRLSSDDPWLSLTSGQTIVLPINRYTLFIKTDVISDVLTEGEETIEFSVREMPPGTLLSNTGPVVRTIVINDTSTGTGFPPAPIAPTGYSGDGSYSFISDPDDTFVMGETSGGSTITWTP